MHINDYYFVKCFGKQSYRDTFNSGKLFFGHVKKYWVAENTFQQDFEGRILQQEGNGLLIAAKPGFENVLKQAHSVQDVEEIVEKRGDIVVAHTTSFSSWINGFICCFYLLPKKDVTLRNNKMVFANDTVKKGFTDFLTNYKGKDGVFAGIYDAARLCRAFDEVSTDQGVPSARDIVKYADMNTTQVFTCFNQGDVASIIFTKPKAYDYQREYRFFLSPKVENEHDYYILSGISMTPCIVATFEYPAQFCFKE